MVSTIAAPEPIWLTIYERENVKSLHESPRDPRRFVARAVNVGLGSMLMSYRKNLSLLPFHACSVITKSLSQ